MPTVPQAVDEHEVHRLLRMEHPGLKACHPQPEQKGSPEDEFDQRPGKTFGCRLVGLARNVASPPFPAPQCPRAGTQQYPGQPRQPGVEWQMQPGIQHPAAKTNQQHGQGFGEEDTPVRQVRKQNGAQNLAGNGPCLDHDAPAEDCTPFECVHGCRWIRWCRSTPVHGRNRVDPGEVGVIQEIKQPLFVHGREPCHAIRMFGLFQLAGVNQGNGVGLQQVEQRLVIPGCP